MKLYRALPQDYEDMVLLWPNCGFADPTDAADAFWRAYPHAPDDEFLTDYIEGICHRGRCPTPRLTAPSPVTGSASLRAIATALLRVETMPARAPYRRLTAATGAARRARLDSGAARRALGGDAGGHLAYRERAIDPRWSIVRRLAMALSRTAAKPGEPVVAVTRRLAAASAGPLRR